MGIIDLDAPEYLFCTNAEPRTSSLQDQLNIVRQWIYHIPTMCLIEFYNTTQNGGVNASQFPSQKYVHKGMSYTGMIVSGAIVDKNVQKDILDSSWKVYISFLAFAGVD